MKKIIALLISLAIISCIFWQDRAKITRNADEKIANLIEYFQDDLTDHDALEDLNSGKYFQNGVFLFYNYAKDLGYYEIFFPKKENTILILRRGSKKITVDQNENIRFYIDGDQFSEGLDIRNYPEFGEYFIDYGNNISSKKNSEEKVLQIALALTNLIESDTLTDMATKNREVEETFLKNPTILKSFF